MNLIAMRTEVLNRGFDSVAYGGRINQWLNDALNLVCRRVDYYGDEAVQTYNTTSGNPLLTLPSPTSSTPTWATYPLPSGGFGRVRELFCTDLPSQIQSALLQDIDRSQASSGRPYLYALDGTNLRLFPTPDQVYPIELRYWQLPPALINDTDTPIIPADWHHLLIAYAVWQAFEADDDAQMGQYWQGRFNTELAEFTSDARFPSTDEPTIAQSMWDHDRGLPVARGWSLYGWY